MFKLNVPKMNGGIFIHRSPATLQPQLLEQFPQSFRNYLLPFYPTLLAISSLVSDLFLPLCEIRKPRAHLYRVIAHVNLPIRKRLTHANVRSWFSESTLKIRCMLSLLMIADG